MGRKLHKHVVLFAFLGMLASLGTAASYPESGQAQMANKPNIVFVLTDDMRASDLDKVVNGQYVIPTPVVYFLA
jgi:hypothetical protein